MSIAAEALRMANDPPKYFGHSARPAHEIPREDIEAMQLAVLQQRFADLRDRLPVLKSTAEVQSCWLIMPTRIPIASSRRPISAIPKLG